MGLALESPPTRRRGSKHMKTDEGSQKATSPPTRRRGSKHPVHVDGHRKAGVASHTEAWIETASESARE